MRYGPGAALIVLIVALATGSDLLACGEKYLCVGRGTRYQRPPNARAASVLIYADPSSGLTAALKSMKADSILKQEGHRATTVETPDQLSAILAGGRFDVVVAASSVAAAVEKLLGGSPDRAMLVTVDARPKARSLLEAIDKAVEQRDRNARKLQSRS
jgi:ABC-type amino acid transport substrate-binding protein